MDFSNVIRFMGQQLDALKNIEDLLAHDEKQSLYPVAHTVKPEEIEHLKNYVDNMKRAAETAKGLAEYYKNLGQPKTNNKETAEQSGQAESGNATEPDKEPGQTEKPKPKRNRKKTEAPATPPTELPAEPPTTVPGAAPESAFNEPGPNGEQSEECKANAEYETNPAPQVPIATPEPAQPDPKPATQQTNIMDLIASISIDNLQG